MLAPLRIEVGLGSVGPLRRRTADLLAIAIVLALFGLVPLIDDRQRAVEAMVARKSFSRQATSPSGSVDGSSLDPFDPQPHLGVAKGLPQTQSTAAYKKAETTGRFGVKKRVVGDFTFLMMPEISIEVHSGRHQMDTATVRRLIRYDKEKKVPLPVLPPHWVKLQAFQAARNCFLLPECDEKELFNELESAANLQEIQESKWSPWTKGKVENLMRELIQFVIRHAKNLITHETSDCLKSEAAFDCLKREATLDCLESEVLWLHYAVHLQLDLEARQYFCGLIKSLVQEDTSRKFAALQVSEGAKLLRTGVKSIGI